jgi:hypothetical protein
MTLNRRGEGPLCFTFEIRPHALDPEPVIAQSVTDKMNAPPRIFPISRHTPIEGNGPAHLRQIFPQGFESREGRNRHFKIRVQIFFLEVQRPFPPQIRTGVRKIRLDLSFRTFKRGANRAFNGLVRRYSIFNLAV